VVLTVELSSEQIGDWFRMTVFYLYNE